MKYQIRKRTISYSKEKAKQVRNLFKETEIKIKEIEEKEDWEKNKTLLQEREGLQKKINEISANITKGIIMRSSKAKKIINTF